MTIAITDRDCVIAAAGTQKKNVQGKHITKELNDIMDKRQSVVASASENDYVKAVTDYDCCLLYTSSCHCPLLGIMC